VMLVVFVRARPEGIPLPAKLREEISSRLIFLSFFLIIQSRLRKP